MRQTPPADEEHVICVKAPEQLIGGPCGEICFLKMFYLAKKVLFARMWTLIGFL